MLKKFRDLKYIKTRENWYPNFKGSEVLVILNIMERNITVSVWGADDFGMEKKFGIVDVENINLAKKLYDEITDNITKNRLRKLGFTEI